MRLFGFVVALAPILTTIGCAQHPYRSLYPQHYTDFEPASFSRFVVGVFAVAGLPEPRTRSRIPGDLIAQLPLDEAIAYYTGHLICFRDEKGAASILANGRGLQQSLAFFGNSSEFLAVRSGFIKRGLVPYDPPGFPHLVCFRPAGDSKDYLDSDWFGDWLRYLSAWEDAQLENRRLRARVTGLRDQVADTRVTIASIILENTALQGKIAEMERKTKEAEADLARAKGATGLSLVSIARTKNEKRIPPFSPRVQYRREIDPFYRVHKENLEYVANRPWYDARQASTEYLDPDLAANLDKLHAALSNPASQPEEIQKLISASKLKTLRVTSVARTPWHQGYILMGGLHGKNPAANYDASPHLFGLGADFSQRYEADSAEYASLQKLVLHFGLSMPVKGDKVHLEPAVRSGKQRARTLAIIREYERVAREERARQAGEKQALIFDRNHLESQKSQLVRDLMMRRAQREQLASVFERTSARYHEVLKEIARIEAERRAREEAERRAREEAARRAREEAERRARESAARHERELPARHSEGWDHPRREPRDVAPPPEREHREPPQRDVILGPLL